MNFLAKFLRGMWLLQIYDLGQGYKHQRKESSIPFRRLVTKPVLLPVLTNFSDLRHFLSVSIFDAVARV